MIKMIKRTLVVLSGLMLFGCAGRDFLRSDSQDFKLGTSTYGQVIQKMGDPRRTGTIIKNDKQVKTITYSYAASGGEALEAEVIPARSQAYSFFDDKLVSEQFLSSFKSDNTNFDDTKISEIIKNKTTKAEVVTLLGKPTGQYIFPATSPNQTLQFGYIYQTVRGGVYTGFKIMIKSLLVGFNSNDVVSDIQYSISDSSK